MPPPYDDVEIGEEITVLVREEGDEIICEAIYRGDNFGGALVTTGMEHLERTTEIDKLVAAVGGLVWNELWGTPVFRDEDEQYVGRVASQRPWEKMERRSTLGYVREVKGGAQPEPDRKLPRDHVAQALGDADVSELRLSQEEMAALMRGEIPDSLTARLLRARSTENLLEAVEDVISRIAGESSEHPELGRALLEIGEVRSRFRHER